MSENGKDKGKLGNKDEPPHSPEEAGKLTAEMALGGGLVMKFTK